MSVRITVKTIQDLMRQDVGVDGDAQRISQLCWMFFLKIVDDQDQELELLRPGYTSPIPLEFQWRGWAGKREGITGEPLLEFVNNKLFPGLKGLEVTGEQGDRARVVRSVFEDAYNYMKSGQLMRQVINKINDVDFNNLAERQHFGDIYEQVLNDLQSAGNAGEYYTPRAVTSFMANRIDPKPGEVLLDPACGTGGFLTSAIRHMRDNYVKTVEDEQRMQQALRAVEKKPLPHMLCMTNLLLHGVEEPSFVRHDNTLARPYVSYGATDRVDIVLTNPPFGGREEAGIESNFPKHFQTRETADLFLALIIRILKPGGRAAVVLPDGSLFAEGVKTRLKEHLLAECNLHTIVRLPNSVFRPYATIGTNLLFFEKGEPTKHIWYYEHRVPAGQKAYSMTKPIQLADLRSCVEWWGGSDRRERSETEHAWRVEVEEVEARGYNLDFRNPHARTVHHGDPDELLRRVTAADQEVATFRTQLKTVLSEALGASPTTAIEQFDRLVALPEAVPQLRRFILELAVRGRLTEQDPRDVPASNLLARAPSSIRQARGKRKGTAQARVDADEPFSIPGSWVWVRVGGIGDARLGKMLDKAKNRGTPRRYLRNTNVRWYDFDLTDVYEMRFEDSELSEFNLRAGDVLICEGGEPGRAAVWDEREPDIYFQKAIHRLRFPPEVVSPRYFVFALKEAASSGRLSAYFTGLTIKHFTGRGLSSFLFSLPPYEEQQRIVARIDSLMTLCDGIEAQRDTANLEGQRLLEAVLRAAVHLAA
jgi:type I restriction enzyme M protein